MRRNVFDLENNPRLREANDLSRQGSANNEDYFFLKFLIELEQSEPNLILAPETIESIKSKITDDTSLINIASRSIEDNAHLKNIHTQLNWVNTMENITQELTTYGFARYGSFPLMVKGKQEIREIGIYRYNMDSLKYCLVTPKFSEKIQNRNTGTRLRPDKHYLVDTETYQVLSCDTKNLIDITTFSENIQNNIFKTTSQVKRQKTNTPITPEKKSEAVAADHEELNSKKKSEIVILDANSKPENSATVSPLDKKLNQTLEPLTPLSFLNETSFSLEGEAYKLFGIFGGNAINSHDSEHELWLNQLPRSP